MVLLKLITAYIFVFCANFLLIGERVALADTNAPSKKVNNPMVGIIISSTLVVISLVLAFSVLKKRK